MDLKLKTGDISIYDMSFLDMPFLVGVTMNSEFQSAPHNQSHIIHIGLMAGVIILAIISPFLGLSDSFTLVVFFIAMMFMHLSHGGHHGNNQESSHNHH